MAAIHHRLPLTNVPCQTVSDSQWARQSPLSTPAVPSRHFKLHQMGGFSSGRCQSVDLKPISRCLMQPRDGQSFTISVYCRMIDDGTDLFSISDIWGRWSHEIKCFIVGNNFYFVSPEWMENFTVIQYAFINCRRQSYWLTAVSQWLIFPSIFISLKHFLHCTLQHVPLVPLTSDVNRENQIIKTIFYYSNPRV